MRETEEICVLLVVGLLIASAAVA